MKRNNESEIPTEGTEAVEVKTSVPSIQPTQPAAPPAPVVPSQPVAPQPITSPAVPETVLPTEPTQEETAVESMPVEPQTMTIQEIAPDLLDTKSAQVRPLNRELVAEYAEAMRHGDVFPLITAFRLTDTESNKLVLASGGHRHAAHLEAFGATKGIRVEIREGTLQDAKWFALGGNAKNGKRFSRKELHIAIQKALEHPNSKDMGDRAIARFVGCDGKTVAAERKRYESGAEIPHLTSGQDTQDNGKRTGIDGKKYSSSRRKAKPSSDASAPPDTIVDQAASPSSTDCLHEIRAQMTSSNKQIRTFTELDELCNEGQFDGKKLRKTMAKLQKAVDGLAEVNPVINAFIEAYVAQCNLGAAITVLSGHMISVKSLKRDQTAKQRQYGVMHQKLVDMKTSIDGFSKVYDKLFEQCSTVEEQDNLRKINAEFLERKAAFSEAIEKNRGRRRQSLNVVEVPLALDRCLDALTPKGD